MSQLSMFESDDTIGTVEQWCRRHEIHYVVGVDEAGRGPLAGPVYAAAVGVDVRTLEGTWIETLDDSKELAPEARDHLFEKLRQSEMPQAVTSSDSEIIDEINILEATRRAMEEAVTSVIETWARSPDYVLIDGDRPIEIEPRQRTIVGGDGLSYAIAAASVLAKVSRDRFMTARGEQWPEYQWASNKGYPTPDHRRALDEHGPSPLHRRSFDAVPDSEA